MDGKRDDGLEMLLRKLDAGERIDVGTPEFETMDRCARKARMITAGMNSGYHDEDELREMMCGLIGRDIPGTFRLFPPIYVDFGRNLHIGRDVFINAGCCFQDQGGITIGDGCQIGHQVVFATIDHALDPEHRHDISVAPITLGRNVWVGSHATILKGVTIGDDSVVAAGAVVTRDVPPRTVVAGVPAEPVKKIRRPLNRIAQVPPGFSETCRGNPFKQRYGPQRRFRWWRAASQGRGTRYVFSTSRKRRRDPQGGDGCPDAPDIDTPADPMIMGPGGFRSPRGDVPHHGPCRARRGVHATAL